MKDATKRALESCAATYSINGLPEIAAEIRALIEDPPTPTHCPQCSAALQFVECSNCGFDTSA